MNECISGGRVLVEPLFDKIPIPWSLQRGWRKSAMAAQASALSQRIHLLTPYQFTDGWTRYVQCFHQRSLHGPSVTIFAHCNSLVSVAPHVVVQFDTVQLHLASFLPVWFSGSYNFDAVQPRLAFFLLVRFSFVMSI